MAEFIFMLTQSDSTVPDCLEVYDQVRASRLRWVGFKDVGVPFATLRELAARIRADGRRVVLEVVSLDRDSELRSVGAAVEVGVDMVMGGTHAGAAAPLLADAGVRYFPFPGQVVGHPSVLCGSAEEIAASARELTSREGVHGLDLLAYRFAGDVPELIRRVVAASRGPVVAAGSIESAHRIQAITDLGCWAFTVGGAVFERRFAVGGSVREQVDAVLELARAAEANRSAAERPVAQIDTRGT
jgi:hypothetical protein